MSEQSVSPEVTTSPSPLAITVSSPENGPAKQAKAPKAKPAKAVASKQGGKKTAPQKERKTMKTSPKKATAVPKRKPGPAMAKFKVKPVAEPGICRLVGCKTKTAGVKWCATHKKQIRKAQLKANNPVWRKRIKAGTAKHHVVYSDRPTAWAVKAKEEALKIVKSGHSIIPTVKDFKAILSKGPHPTVRPPKAASA